MELITATEEGQSRIDRATQRATREDAEVPVPANQQGGGEGAPQVPDSETTDDQGNVTKITDNGRIITIFDKNGKLIGGRTVPGPPEPATGQGDMDASPNPAGAAQNRKRIFREYRTRSPQKRQAEGPAEDPRVLGGDDQS